MSLMTSLMYAAGAVAILAVMLECFCRRRLRQFRDDPNIAALNGRNMNDVPYPVGAPYPVAQPVGVGRPALVVYPMPVPIAAVCDDDADFFFRSYATPTVPQTQNTSETPPPTYDQVMANEQANAQKTRPG